jgi:hypothetical protein
MIPIKQVSGGGVDTTAIHDNVDDEIVAVTEKVTPVDADVLLIEDSAASYAKKRVQIGNLPGGGGGISEADHKILRQLIHFIDNGPAEGFASAAYRTVTGTVFPTAIIWYDKATAGKVKIVEKLISWTGVNPTTIAWKVYDAAEALIATVSDAVSYTGVFETSRTRTITIA